MVGYHVMNALAGVTGGRFVSMPQDSIEEKAVGLQHVPVKEILYS